MILHPSRLSSMVVPLTDAMHEQAEQNCPSYLSLAESESIYLNTLSIYAVDHYLKRLGYTTAHQPDMMINPVLQSFLDVAPIEVLAPATIGLGENAREKCDSDRPTAQWCGTLECRRVMPNDQTMHISEAALHEDRAGYVAVQFNDDLSEAHVLGYVAQPDSVDVLLDELRSLEQLCTHLEQMQSTVVINLKQWLDGIFQPGWEAIATVLQSHQLQLAPVRTRKSMVPVRTRKNIDSKVERGCVVTLGDESIKVSLVMDLEQTSDCKYAVGIEFWPAEGMYLPENLQMAVLDHNDQVVMEAKTRDDHQKLEMNFEGETNDQFSIRIGTSEVSITKKFML